MVAESKWWQRPNGGSVQMMAESKWWQNKYFSLKEYFHR
jgi:hypothetical protein